MNDADRNFLRYLIRTNQDVATAAARCVRDGDDKSIRALAQSEINEDKTETPKLQKVLGGSLASTALSGSES